jgi:4-diphosphocytidyl-2-C-methyl-D-erythritol kinase
LAGLNQLWRLALKREDLIALSAVLGSDVAFFFATPAAWCTGRGEQVMCWSVGRPLFFVLACPAVGLSTAEVYRGVTVPAQPESGTEIRQALANGDVEEIGRRLHNRLQPVAERLCAPVAVVQARLAQCHPAGQLMSGSGTTVFALCRDRAEALRIARELAVTSDASAGSGLKLFIVRSCV